MAITTRAGKGSALTHSEMDANLNQIPNGANSSITDDGTNVTISGNINGVNADGLSGVVDSTFAQHGLVPNDGVNEIRPQDFFVEVNTPNIVAVPEDIARNYKVRFTDGVYSLDHLIEEIE